MLLEPQANRVAMLFTTTQHQHMFAQALRTLHQTALQLEVGIYVEQDDPTLVQREAALGFTGGDKFDSQLKFQNINDLRLNEPAAIIGAGRDYILVTQRSRIKCTLRVLCTAQHARSKCTLHTQLDC
eukprot:3996-Heterococcus_DN1.PRE.6